MPTHTNLEREKSPTSSHNTKGGKSKKKKKSKLRPLSGIPEGTTSGLRKRMVR